MNCPNCNNHLDDNARFCSQCGTAIRQTISAPIQQPPVTVYPPAKKSAPKWLLPAIIIVALVIIIILIAILVLRGTQNGTTTRTPAAATTAMQGIPANEPVEEIPANDPIAETPQSPNVQPTQAPVPTTNASVPSNLFAEPNPNAGNADRIAWFKSALAQVVDLNKYRDSSPDDKRQTYQLISSERVSRPNLNDEFTMNGITFRWFMTYNEITANGLWFDHCSTSSKIQPGSAAIVTFKKAGYSYIFHMGNATYSATDRVEDLILIGVWGNLDDRSDQMPNILLPFSNGSLDNNSSPADIFSLLDDPDNVGFLSENSSIYVIYNLILESNDKMQLKYDIDSKTGRISDVSVVSQG